MDKLKPCPSCGKKCLAIDRDTGAVACMLCGMRAPNKDVWNRRAEPENKLQCDGCENQKRDGFNHEVCVHCKQHWPDHYARKPEGSTP